MKENDLPPTAYCLLPFALQIGSCRINQPYRLKEYQYNFSKL